MSWLAKNRRNTFCEIVPGITEMSAKGGIMPRGSIVLELSTSQDGPTPTRLLHLENNSEWESRISVYLNADFSIAIEIQQGSRRCYGRVDGGSAFSSEDMRVTYSWDAPSRAALLSIEGTRTGFIRQTLIDSPLPIRMFDVLDLCRNEHWSTNDNRIEFVAVSDDFQPVGPCPSIAEGNHVLTQEGFKPIERLRLDDRVATGSGRFSKVRWIIGQDLPAAGTFRPVRLRAPYLGIHKDIIVSASHKVLIEGPDAEYLFGEDAVFIEASQLCSTHAGEWVSCETVTRYYQVLLDRHDCINVSGAWCESLFVGGLARNRKILMTTRLSQLSTLSVPKHNARVRPILRNYEAQSLVQALTA